MYSLPANCPNCGLIFPSSFGVSNSAGNFKGNIEICPRCGGAAYLAEGIIAVLGDVVSLLESPDGTKEMFEAVGFLVRELAEGQISIDEAQERAAKISPDAHVVVANIRSFWSRHKESINLLLSIASFLINFVPQGPTSHDKLQYELLQRIWQRQEEILRNQEDERRSRENESRPNQPQQPWITSIKMDSSMNRKQRRKFAARKRREK